MKVKIYQTCRNAMQSGRAHVRQWVLEYERVSPRTPDSLMGWSSSQDTNNQVQLHFDNEEDAIHYAQDKGWNINLRAATPKLIRPRNYGDNFRYIKTES